MLETSLARYGRAENATDKKEEIAASTCEIVQQMNAQTEARV